MGLKRLLLRLLVAGTVVWLLALTAVLVGRSSVERLFLFVGLVAVVLLTRR